MVGMLLAIYRRQVGLGIQFVELPTASFKMKRFFENQFPSLFLWSPFLMAFGAGLYFSTINEPPFVYPMTIAILIGAILIFRRTRIITTAILLFIFGFFYACGFTRLIDTPQLSRNLRNAEINGIVTNIDYTNNKSRVFIKTSIDGKTALVRLSVGTDQYVPKIGDKIHATVTLFKPSVPSAPDSFDYARWAYFNRISATGYLNDYIDKPISANNSMDINNLRDYIHRKTNSFLSDTLVLGYKNAVPKDDAPAWTATGVGHVWSISGFHMTLVGGWLSIFFYLIFRSIPPITRRIPARFPAMICAWFGLLFYLFLSGIDVATVRAFLMTTLIFAAFLFGRNSFSLRNICIAFGLIFLMNPHYVMQPGFQLSFAAIFGLIWYFGGGKYKKLSIFKKALRAINAATMTSIIATIFTAPFVAYHFYSMPIYGLIGNLILLPVFSFAIMPLVLIGTVAGLFGIHAPLIWSEKIYGLTLNMANWISELPFATVQIPSIPGSALLLIVLGFLCLMFIRNTERFKYANYVLFVLFTMLGLIVITTNKRPLFYATYDHELVAFVNDRKLEFNKARASNHYFAFEAWKHLNFEPATDENRRRKCDRGVCIYKTPNWTLVYMQRFMPLSRNIVKFCNDPEIDFIVSYFRIESEKCNHKILRNGFVIYESGKIKYTPTNRWWHGFNIRQTQNTDRTPAR